SEVSINEAAVLVGMLKGNTLYNPRRNPERALARRNTVLSQMVKYNFLDSKEAEQLKKEPIVLDYHKLDYHEGIAPYFRQEVEKEVKAILKNIKKPGSQEPYNIYKDGLKIYTTLNVKMQRYAEQSVEEHLTELQALFRGQSGYHDGSIWKKDLKVNLARAVKQSPRYKSLIEAGLSEEEINKIFETPVKMKVFTWKGKKEIDTVMSPLDSIKYMKMF